MIMSPIGRNDDHFCQSRLGYLALQVKLQIVFLVNFQRTLISPGSLPHRVERSVPMSDISEQHFFFRFEHRILPKPNYDVQILAGNFKIFQDDAVRIQRKFLSSLSVLLSVCLSSFLAPSFTLSLPPCFLVSFSLS